MNEEDSVLNLFVADTTVSRFDKLALYHDILWQWGHK